MAVCILGGRGFCRCGGGFSDGLGAREGGHAGVGPLTAVAAWWCVSKERLKMMECGLTLAVDGSSLGPEELWAQGGRSSTTATS